MTATVQLALRPVGRRKVVVLAEQQLAGESLAGALKRRHRTVTSAALAKAAMMPATTELVVVLVETAVRTAVQALQQAASAAPDARRLVVGPDDAQTVLQVLRAGAHGYVVESDGMDQFDQALGLVLAGQTAIDPALLHRALQPPASTASERERVLQRLTRRERDVLALLCEGLGADEISQRLGMAPSTARTHIQRVLAKLGASTRLEATTMAARLQLFDRSSP